MWKKRIAAALAVAAASVMLLRLEPIRFWIIIHTIDLPLPPGLKSWLWGWR